MARLLLLPKTVDLALYAGDGVQLRLGVQTSAGDPWDLSGAVIAQIRADRADQDPLEEFQVDLSDAADGVAVLSLSGDQTSDLVSGDADFAGAWDVQWTPAGDEPVTLIQGSVSCTLDVSR